MTVVLDSVIPNHQVQDLASLKDQINCYHMRASRKYLPIAGNVSGMGSIQLTVPGVMGNSV